MAGEASEYVPLHVVYRDEWFIPREGEGLGKVDADPERRLEPGARCDRDGVYRGRLCLGEEFEQGLAEPWLTLKELGNRVVRLMRERLRVFSEKLGLLECRGEDWHEILGVFALGEI